MQKNRSTIVDVELASRIQERIFLRAEHRAWTFASAFRATKCGEENVMKKCA
jgi:hypothetical protein